LSKKEEEAPLDTSSFIERFPRVVNTLADPIRKLKRAVQGLTLDEDFFSGLLNIKDLRERTRVTEVQAYSHSVMRILADLYPYEFGIAKDMAIMEDTYFIAIEGEQRKEAILMTRAKSTIQVQGLAGEGIQIPQVETTPPESPKRGLRDRIRGRKNE